MTRTTQTSTRESAVISCDNVVTVPGSSLGGQIGVLLRDQEDALTTGIHAAFDLA